MIAQRLLFVVAVLASASMALLFPESLTYHTLSIRRVA